MRSRDKNPPAAGFTLIEILVAVTILTMIFSIVFGTFFYTINNAEEREEQAALYHRANFILNGISQNVSSAYVPFAGDSRSYIEEEGEDRDPIFFGRDDYINDSDADSLSLFTANPRFGSDSTPGNVSHVNYQVSENFELEEWRRDEHNPLTLGFSANSLLLLDPEKTQWTLNIRSLNIEYFDGVGWLQEWSYEGQGVLPRAMRVSLGLADSTGAPHIFSTVVTCRVNTLLEELPEEQEQEEQEEKEEQEEQEEQEQQEQQEDRQRKEPERERESKPRDRTGREQEDGYTDIFGRWDPTDGSPFDF